MTSTSVAPPEVITETAQATVTDTLTFTIVNTDSETVTVIETTTYETNLDVTATTQQTTSTTTGVSYFSFISNIRRPLPPPSWRPPLQLQRGLQLTQPRH